MHKETIAIGSDHAGFELKAALIPFIEELGYEVVDKGAFAFEEQDDYPDFIIPVARAVAQGEATRGVILGGSGQGEAMAANRIQGVRAAVYYGGPSDIIALSREHNNANVLSLGARFLSTEEAKEALKQWLGTAYSDAERHNRRINKIEELSS